MADSKEVEQARQEAVKALKDQQEKLSENQKNKMPKTKKFIEKNK